MREQQEGEVGPVSRLKPQQSVPLMADAAYENLRAESLYGQLASSSCRRFWWYTGDFEITTGTWLVAVGLILSAFPIDSLSSVAGWLLLGLSLAIPVMLPTALRNGVIMPRGLCISAPPRPRASRALVLLAGALYVAMGVLAFRRGDPFALPTMASAALALMALIAYGRSGCPRHFVLGALFAAVVPVLYRQLTLAVAARVHTGQRATGILAFLGMGSTLPLALTVMTVGTFVLVSGAVRFGRTVRERAVARVDKAEAQRLVIGLAAPDQRVRFLTAAYLCENPAPVTVVRLVYGAFDKNLAIAETMRLALVRVWGPSAQRKLDWYLGQTSLKGKRAVEYTAEEWHLRRDAVARFTQEERDAFDEVAREVRRQAPRGDDLYLRLAELSAGGEDELFQTLAYLMGFTREQAAYQWLARTIVESAGKPKRAHQAALGFAGADEAAVPYLTTLLADERGWVRTCALQATNALLETLERTDGQSFGARRCRELLHDPAFCLAGHPSSLTRAYALDVLGAYGLEAAPVLAQRCRDRSALVRSRALLALARVDEYRAGQYVFEALADEHAVVREAAVRCAEDLHLIRAMNRVVPLVNDPSEAVSSLANEFILLSQSW